MSSTAASTTSPRCIVTTNKALKHGAACRTTRTGRATVLVRSVDSSVRWLKALPDSQVLLLRFLESGEIQPVGSDASSRTVDVRIVAATNRNLKDLIAQGAFREDLLYRLNVIHLHVPPLSDRCDDIRPLIQATLARRGRAVVFSEDALQVLERYSWPGNVRELQNVIEQGDVARWIERG